MIASKAMWAGVLGASVVFLFLWEQVSATKLGYELSRARQELSQKRDEVERLRLEFARLHAPERLASAARERLGMTPSTPERLVFLGSGLSRTAAPPKPERRYAWNLEEPRYLTKLIE